MPDGKTYDDGTLECARQMKKMLQMFSCRKLGGLPLIQCYGFGRLRAGPGMDSSQNPPCGQCVELIVAESAGWRKPAPD